MVAAAPPFVELELTWRSTPAPAGSPAHQIDLRHAETVAELVRTVAPDVVVHTAYSIRDRADIVDATRNLALACSATGTSLVHLSTDALFDGEHAPYAESDQPSPITDYGRWKADAERLALDHVPDVCITRSSLVISIEPPDPATAAVLGAGRGHGDMTFFHDEIRQPIFASDLAVELWSLVALDRATRSGVWHLPGAQAWSRLQLGRRICEIAGLDPEVLRPGSQADHPGPRPRDLTMTSGRRGALGHPPRQI